MLLSQKVREDRFNCKGQQVYKLSRVLSPSVCIVLVVADVRVQLLCILQAEQIWRDVLHLHARRARQLLQVLAHRHTQALKVLKS